MRTEKDLLGELQIPDEAYYGVQTQRALNNFDITGIKLYNYPEFIKGLAYTKWGAILANHELGFIDAKIKDGIVAACKEVISGKFDDQFKSDMIQGGAGTSSNMNANEVIANVALEIMGHKKGEYEFCSPHEHVNWAQSTNDAYPTAIKIAVYNSNIKLNKHLDALIDAFRAKGQEFSNVLKMGRTQLQDAVPMTLGQEFNAFAKALELEKARVNHAAEELLVVNMGATAIGTGLNAAPGYAELCAKKLAEVTGHKITKAEDLVQATPDTSEYVYYSGAIKGLAVLMNKICNDLRLLGSGPRCGFGDINLPEKQPGSSIMPGKVNPVIPEAMNQTCYRIIGFDTANVLASENGQLQLNVMEPVILYNILESIETFAKAMDCLKDNCILGITANEEHTMKQIKNSIGIVTALNPHIGYKTSTEIAKEAKDTNRGVYELVLEKGILTKEQLDEILDPKNMLGPQI